MENEKIDAILRKLNDIEIKLAKIENDTQAMSDHIQFINVMYEKYKNGLDFVHTIFSRCK